MPVFKVVDIAANMCLDNKMIKSPGFFLSKDWPHAANQQQQQQKKLIKILFCKVV